MDALGADVVLDADATQPHELESSGRGREALIADSGQVAFPALVPLSDLAADETLARLGDAAHGVLYAWAAQAQRLVACPCPDAVNIGAVVDKHAMLPGGGHGDGMAAQLRAHFGSFHASARPLLNHVRDATP